MDTLIEETNKNIPKPMSSDCQKELKAIGNFLTENEWIQLSQIISNSREIRSQTEVLGTFYLDKSFVQIELKKANIYYFNYEEEEILKIDFNDLINSVKKIIVVFKDENVIYQIIKDDSVKEYRYQTNDKENNTSYFDLIKGELETKKSTFF